MAREIDHRSPSPPYRQIAAYLVADITAGVFAVGAPIPSEKELCEAYGVARNTVRNAVRWLRDAGYVETVVGRGSYVLDRASSTDKAGANESA
ncbi:GntR family transcriptional regulator [Streptodolium elevatio]|uniref:Winged helix-turn-helix domain-containing protein n=1 Tax=Streptodolium elevatio TaxID=3157996 RepID=A0ABV3D885_9ACTN